MSMSGISPAAASENPPRFRQAPFSPDHVLQHQQAVRTDRDAPPEYKAKQLGLKSHDVTIAGVYEIPDNALNQTNQADER